MTACASAQTDEFIVFPYEHLFPTVLPQWFSSQQQNGTVVNGTASGGNPYDLLDKCIEASVEGGGHKSGEPNNLSLLATIDKWRIVANYFVYFLFTVNLHRAKFIHFTVVLYISHFL
jgi:hypothetical protein